MILAADWTRRIAAVEQLDVEGRARCLRDAGRLGARVERVGGATCVTADVVETHLYNRAFEVTVGDLGAVAAHHRELRRPCYIDVHPHMGEHGLGRALQAHGFALSNTNAVHLCETWTGSERAPGIRLVSSSEDWDAFEQAEHAGWGRAQAALGRLQWGRPGYRAFIAWVDGRAAATGVVFVHEEVAYLASASTVPRFRRRGLHHALIQHRIQEAHERGARVAFSQAFFGERSSRDLARAGLPLAYTSPLFADLGYWDG